MISVLNDSAHGDDRLLLIGKSRRTHSDREGRGGSSANPEEHVVPTPVSGGYMHSTSGLGTERLRRPAYPRFEPYPILWTGARTLIFLKAHDAHIEGQKSQERGQRKP